MEPIASSGAGAVFRPTGSGASDVQALLRDGRVLKAEVLQHTAEGTVLLAIGRQTIPAETELRLDPGASFLVRVEESAQGIVLRALAPEDGESALLRALRAVVGQGREFGPALGELGRMLGTGKAPELAPELRALALRLAEVLSGTPADGAGLRALLPALGFGHEAALATLLGARAARGTLDELRGNLKALLLRARAVLEGAGPERAPLRDSIERALASLEAEQLLNLAREKAGEPVVLSFPFPDGDGWATARLAVPPRGEREEAPRGEGEAPFRLSLGLELSNLGPLRADLTLARGVLSLRLLVTRADVVSRVERALAELRARLGGAGRAVDVQVRRATPAETALGLDPLDIRYLRERHLMNVAG